MEGRDPPDAAEFIVLADRASFCDNSGLPTTGAGDHKRRAPAICVKDTTRVSPSLIATRVVLLRQGRSSVDCR
jgi:hypothetical protein